MSSSRYDPQALRVAEAVHCRENPQATILFGSRARGDYEEDRSDIDIMLVLAEKPGRERKEAAAEWAQEVAVAAYGRRVPVQLVWLERAEFDAKQRYINHVATRALRDGVVMSPNPDDFHSRHADDDEETEYEYEWTDYQNRLYHARSHLEAFEHLDDAGFNDLLIGQQAQSALEHAMKAIIAGHGGVYRSTHNLAHLLGSVRRIDPEMRDFRLSIPPDIYSAYAGGDEYAMTPEDTLLTGQENYRERTVADLRALIDRASQLGPGIH